jgi:hypothetical protein
VKFAVKNLKNVVSYQAALRLVTRPIGRDMLFFEPSDSTWDFGGLYLRLVAADRTIGVISTLTVAISC